MEKRTREQKIDLAYHKMDIAPYGLTWFKFFKVAALIIIIVLNAITLVGNLNDVFTLPDYTATLEEYGEYDYLLIDGTAYENFYPQFSASYRSVITCFGYLGAAVGAFICVLAFALIFKLRELDVTAYKLLTAFLFAMCFLTLAVTVGTAVTSYVVFSDAVQLVEVSGGVVLDGASYMVLSEVPGVSGGACIGECVFAVIRSGVGFVLNMIYFTKRKSLFTDELLELEQERLNSRNKGYSELEEDKKICNNCGSLNSANTSFCENCGRNF